jgi:hypothetical protein
VAAPATEEAQALYERVQKQIEGIRS